MLLLPLYLDLSYFLCLVKCKALKAGANICNKLIGLQQVLEQEQRQQCLAALLMVSQLKSRPSREKAALDPAAQLKKEHVEAKLLK